MRIVRVLNVAARRRWAWAVTLATALVLAGAVPARAATSYDWAQYGESGWTGMHNGSNSQETTINIANVPTLTRRFRATLPGVADGNPVYLTGVSTTGGTRDLVFVTTRNAYITALDAHTGTTVWSKFFGSSSCVSSNGGACYTTSSPVIDPNRQYVYTYGLDGYVHRLQVGTGNEVTGGGWPELATLKPTTEKGSSALSIAATSSGTFLYVANGGYPGDAGDYQGHITAINLADGSQHVFNALCSNITAHLTLGSTPDCSQTQSAVWARPGVMYDPDTGKIYFATGNGTFDPTHFNWGDSVLALNPNGTGSTSIAGDPVDSYTPSDFATLQNQDTDLGSTGPAIIPAGAVPASSLYQHLGVQCGKDGYIRLLNLDNLSGMGTPGKTGGEVFSMALPIKAEVLSQPAIWQNPADGKLWVFVVNDQGIMGMTLAVDGTGHPSLQTAWSTVMTTRGSLGSSPLVANGVLYDARTSLVEALDPTTGHQLWHDSTIGGIHWEGPVVASGALFINDESSTLTAWSVPATPTITASPNPVPAGSTTTTITWSTGDGSLGQVWVSANGGADAIFAQGASGAGTAPWIEPGSTYVFKLFAGTSHTTQLASVTVTQALGTISASPNPVPASSSTTTVTWSTGDGSIGQVYVTDGGGDVLFAQGASGAANATWIQPNTSYVFKLFAGTTHTTQLASVTVTRSAAIVTASPNPVPSGSTTTSISWDTGDGTTGQVWVSRDGSAETLFAQGPSGGANAPWIEPGSTYVFTLYAGTSHTTKLDSVTVT